MPSVKMWCIFADGEFVPAWIREKKKDAEGLALAFNYASPEHHHLVVPVTVNWPDAPRRKA